MENYSSSSSSSEEEDHCSTCTNKEAKESSPGLSSGLLWSVNRTLNLVQSEDLDSMLQGAREIRRLTKTSQKCRRLLCYSVVPLISMLRIPDSPEAHEAALLALLNLAVKDETYVSPLYLRVFPRDFIYEFEILIGWKYTTQL